MNKENHAKLLKQTLIINASKQQPNHRRKHESTLPTQNRRGKSRHFPSSSRFRSHFFSFHPLFPRSPFSKLTKKCDRFRRKKFCFGHPPNYQKIQTQKNKQTNTLWKEWFYFDFKKVFYVLRVKQREKRKHLLEKLLKML